MAASGCDQHPASLRDALDSRYAALQTAMSSKDEGAIRAVLADGFVSVGVRGNSEGAADVIKEVLALPANPTRHSKTTIVSVKGDDRSATVEQNSAMTQQTAGDDGVAHSVRVSTLSRDRWVNDHGTWRIARTATEKFDYAMDGVTVDHRENSAVR
ncbi:MAG: nuclear transport factor 2 family protein [Sphingomicrobium sp.]